MIRTLLILLAMVAISHATTTILATGARNVKTDYGAAGDGTTDDTTSFQNALSGSGGHSIYVPPGTYLISGTLTVPGGAHMFGEPSSVPTLELKSASLVNNGNGFINITGGNNTFEVDFHTFNIHVLSNNGSTDALQWGIGQRSAVRDVSITIDSTGNSGICFHSLGNGGDNTVANVTCTGGGKSVYIESTSQSLFRGCTFNGTVTCVSNWLYSFVDCTFGGNVSATGGNYITLSGCSFTNSATFSSSIPWRVSNTTGLSSLPGGGTPGTGIWQAASANVYYNGTSEAGNSSNLNAGAATFPNPAPVYPPSGTVNVANYGTGYSAVTSALAASSSIYFPPGTWSIGNNTITLPAGGQIWGAGGDLSQISGSASPVITVQGAGTGNGVHIEGVTFIQTSTGHVMTWNGDPSSQVISCAFSNTSQTGNGSCADNPGTISAWVDIQSGGLFWEEMESALNSSEPEQVLGETFLSNEANGPVYILGMCPEHMGGPVFVFSGGSNCFINTMEWETLSQNTSWTVSNWNNLSVDAFLAGDVNCGNFSFTNVVVAFSGTTAINFFGFNSVNGSGAEGGTVGVLSNGGNTYGSSGNTFFQGYATTMIPAVPGTLSTVTYSTPATPGTLTTVKQ